MCQIKLQWEGWQSQALSQQDPAQNLQGALGPQMFPPNFIIKGSVMARYMPRIKNPGTRPPSPGLFVVPSLHRTCWKRRGRHICSRALDRGGVGVLGHQVQVPLFHQALIPGGTVGS